MRYLAFLLLFLVGCSAKGDDLKALGELVKKTPEPGQLEAENKPSPINNLAEARSFGGFRPSSIDFKTNVLPIPPEHARKIISDLQPVLYFYKPEFQDGDSSLQYGFLAEDIARTHSEFVHFEYGKPVGVYYDKFNAVLVKAIQDQDSKITRLTWGILVEGLLLALCAIYLVKRGSRV